MTKGLSFDELFPGKYIKAGEFQGKAVTLTIRAVEREMLSNGTGGEEGAAIVSFAETDKQFVMNKTNGVCFRALFGDDTGEWLGHRVTLHAVKDESGLSESGQCIRVKGSPEIQQPLKFRAHLGRKQVTQTLLPTVKPQGPRSDALIGQEAPPVPNEGEDATTAVSDAPEPESYWPDEDAETVPDAAAAEQFVTDVGAANANRFPETHKEMPGGITKQQMRALNVQWRKLADAGWSDEQLRALLLRETGKLSRKTLTMGEASKAVKALALEVQDLGTEATA
jgi:hypothetical protein